MDSITQFVLGAAVGEAVLKPAALNDSPESKKFGLGAFLLGGLMGTLPDLDVLARPWLNGPQALGFHRGVTHSLFFCSLVTPLLAWLLQRLFKRYDLSPRRWLAFVWLALNTHWMIDSLTIYGTQVFLPFTNYPVNIGSVFIVDPLYTLPLLMGTLFSLFRGVGGRPIAPGGVRFALAFSTVYLFLTLGSKYVVMHRFTGSLAERGIVYKQLMTAPTPFNSVLWYCYADTGEDVWVGDSSLLDPWERQIPWRKIPKNRELLPRFGEGAAGKRLLWFSRGFYRLDIQGEAPVFIDLRFGRLRSWLKPIDPQGNDYLFRYALKPAKMEGPYHDFGRFRPQGGFSQFPWDIFWRRVFGKAAS